MIAWSCGVALTLGVGCSPIGATEDGQPSATSHHASPLPAAASARTATPHGSSSTPEPLRATIAAFDTMLDYLQLSLWHLH